MLHPVNEKRVIEIQSREQIPRCMLAPTQRLSHLISGSQDQEVPKQKKKGRCQETQESNWSNDVKLRIKFTPYAPFVTQHGHLLLKRRHFGSSQCQVIGRGKSLKTYLTVSQWREKHTHMLTKPFVSAIKVSSKIEGCIPVTGHLNEHHTQ